MCCYSLEWGLSIIVSNKVSWHHFRTQCKNNDSSCTTDWLVKLLTQLFFSVPHHRILFRKLRLCDIIKCCCIQMPCLTQPNTTLKAPLSCEHAVRVTWNSAWHEAPTFALHIMRRVCGCGNTPCQDGFLSFSLAGVNGASFCLVQHPCYFDVLAVPLPDQ